ncbi:MAG TPA: tyrosine-type recombinase/integrase [Candidatus Saccharimonadales bacterium]|nr:tyrosine-type recombinase/integrase [Candidatus Saccharimonadales bacterium]
MNKATRTRKTVSTTSISISNSASDQLLRPQPSDPQRRDAGPSLADAVELACRSCATPATARSYRAALSAFAKVCADQGVTQCSEIDPSVTAAFPASLTGRSAATRHHRLAVVKAFLRWAAQAGWCDSACAALITPSRRVRRTTAPTWSEDDCRKLLSSAETWRDRALTSTGARIGEVVHATVGDFDGQTLRLSGKTGTRSVPLSPDARDAVNWYLQHRQPLEPAAPLFASRQGRLSERQARDLVYAPCRRARLAPGGPHTLRHAAATRWLRAGVPLVVVSATLGHSRPSTTLDHYAGAMASDLARGLSSDPLWSEGEHQAVAHSVGNGPEGMA